MCIHVTPQAHSADTLRNPALGEGLVWTSKRDGLAERWIPVPKGQKRTLPFVLFLPPLQTILSPQTYHCLSCLASLVFRGTGWEADGDDGAFGRKEKREHA